MSVREPITGPGVRWVRPPAVAGLFYPERPQALGDAVAAYLAEAMAAPVAGPAGPPPKVLVVPHAGYVYSAPVAARAYALLAASRDVIERVVLIGPAHRVYLEGLAVTGADTWATPLGQVPIDVHAREMVLTHPSVAVDDNAHAPEHCLEVQLPFLQEVLGDFAILPLLAGRVAPEVVADVLELVWGDDETVIVVSTDLSHYHDHRTAQRLDRRTASAVVASDVAAIDGADACGAAALRGAMVAGARHGLVTSLLDLRTSGDTAGPRDRVVGYGAFSMS